MKPSASSRVGKMTSSGKYGVKILLGFVLLVSWGTRVWTADLRSLDATSNSSQLDIGDRLVSVPNGIYEMGIFEYGTDHFLSIRYAPPVDQAVTWLAYRNIPLSEGASLRFLPNGTLQLFDQNNYNNRNLWSTPTANRGVARAQLLDSGNLVLVSANDSSIFLWSTFENSPPSDTLLPGQYMHRNQSHSLTSWQKSGNPAIASDSYVFGWDARRVLALSWVPPQTFLHWKGGNYIPPPDVYAAHTIADADNVYFHETRGHLYVGVHGHPDTAILSSGDPDPVNTTTLRRLTLQRDGSLTILAWRLKPPWNETSKQTWTPLANWVVAERPGIRSRCAVFGACGPHSLCVSPIDSLEPVSCQCPGSNDSDPERAQWFKPFFPEDLSRGCFPPKEHADCNVTDGTGVGLLELPGVDLPWGGDYKNFTGNESLNCAQHCKNDCYCAGAVLSRTEQKCWLKNGVLLNMGYPSQDLHGTDRTSYLRNQTAPDYFPPPKKGKDEKLVKILVPTLGGLAVILIVAAIIWLCRSKTVKERARVCLPQRRPVIERFRGDEEETPGIEIKGRGVD